MSDLDFMNLIIRPMSPDDFPRLAAWMVETPLWQRYGLTEAKAIAHFEAGMTRDEWLITADSETPACGFAWAIPNGAFGRSPYLRLIGVQPGITGTGIGAQLLLAVEAWSMIRSNDLFLLVSDFNIDGQRFYNAHGYRQIGAIPDYVQSNITELIFQKRLR